MIRIGTFQYKIEELNWNSYSKKITNLIEIAKNADVQLVVLPEYAGLEIGGQHDNDRDLFDSVQNLIPAYIELYQQLASKFDITIQPGTLPFRQSLNKYFNRAYLFGPNKFGYQDKLQIVEFEKESGIIIQGHRQTIFDTSFGKIAIAICYDSEFPEIVRLLVNAGVKLILVPSYANSLASYHRVSISCRARAIENQCYIVASFAVGAVVSGCSQENVEHTHGRAGIYAPADINFPDNGIISEGTMNEIQMVTGFIDFEAIDSVRNSGRARNYIDSQNLDLVEIVTLCI